jgi:hypothetical protein
MLIIKIIRLKCAKNHIKFKIMVNRALFSQAQGGAQKNRYMTASQYIGHG